MCLLGGFMVLTQLPHRGGGQCLVQEACVESPWCPPSTSPSPWPADKCPLPLFWVCMHPTAVTFLLLFSSPQPGKPLLTGCLVPKPACPLHDQPHPELVTPCPGSWVLCSGSEVVYLSPSLAERISLRLSHTHSWKKPGAK